MQFIFISSQKQVTVKRSFLLSEGLNILLDNSSINVEQFVS